MNSWKTQKLLQQKNTIRENSMRKEAKLQSQTRDILLVDFLVEL